MVAGSDGTDPASTIPDAPARGPAAKALEHEFEATLTSALKQLPTEWRAAVVLRDLEDLSTKDAANVVGIREAAFKSRLHRGRMQLREVLMPYLELKES